jgi:hypothetical protein
MLNFQSSVKSELISLLVNFLVCALIGVFIYQGYTMFHDSLTINEIRLHNLTHRVQEVEKDLKDYNRSDSDTESDHSEKDVKSL